MFDEAFWDDRYQSATAVWSGHPNPQLVAEVTDLRPGTALDVGSGEGGDALWLASRGWQVTGVDFARTALARAAAQADALGLSARWVHADLLTWVPDRAFDLVSAHFMHLPTEQRVPLFARLAAAVASGGTLLVVGHHMSDLETTAGRPDLPDYFFTADEVAESLTDGWTVEVADKRPRQVADPDGHTITIHDAILRATRSR
jgi:trans-aconitate methyltransferase